MTKSANYQFPESPEHLNDQITKPSDEFRKEVFGVFGAIILFVFTYVILIIAGLAIAALCIVAAYLIVTNIFNVWLILFSIGLVIMGILIVGFLFKFIFKKTSVDRSGMTEIKRTDHPVLFDFIDKVAQETHAPLPRKVFLSSDVNAFVFYDSSFWSMFLPIRKNLNIGLGLVNCVSLSEFKAVLAHEFGHFSQRSMKLNSYVYHVNHIIYNILFDNKGYGETLAGIAELNGAFNLVATMTYGVTRAIQHILSEVYQIIRRRSLALSRQMEFHADAVAASVSGSAPLIRALYRLEFAESCYNNVLGIYNNWVPQNRKGTNLFAHHTLVMNDFASYLNLRVEHGLVQVGASDVRKHRRTRIVVKDQWASHPSTEDREAQLLRLGIQAPEVNDSAWVLFSNAIELQQTKTKALYSEVKFTAEPTLVDSEAFKSFTREQSEKYSLHPLYLGFYDGRDLTPFDPDTLSSTGSPVPESISEILTPEVLTLQPHLAGLDADIEVLMAIGSRDNGITTFDFDGTRYTRDESAALLEKLKTEKESLVLRLARVDEDIFLLYYRKASLAGNAAEAIAHYKHFFHQYPEINKKIYSISLGLQKYNILYDPSVDPEDRRMVINDMFRYRREVSAEISSLMNDVTYEAYLGPEVKQVLTSFISDGRDFRDGNMINHEPAQLYGNALSAYQKILIDHGFDLKKQLLNEQARMLEGPSLVATPLVS